MKNKRLTLILVIFAVVVLITTLSSTLFMLSSVKVNFLCNNTLFVDAEDEIINSGLFDYGKNVMLLNKQKHINNLEANNTYLKIINLEIKFPNELIINCVQRSSLFCVKTLAGNYFVVDEDFKILEICDDKPNNIIFLDNLIVSNLYNNADFIDFEQNKLILNSILLGLYEWNNNNDFLKLKIKEITLSYQSNDKICVIMQDGKKLIVDKIENLSSEKFNIVFSVYCSQVMVNKNYVLVYENSENCIKCVVG